jgi:hypothetical protein
MNPPPSLTGDMRTDRALVNLARLLLEIARAATPAGTTARPPVPPERPGGRRAAPGSDARPTLAEDAATGGR